MLVRTWSLLRKIQTSWWCQNAHQRNRSPWSSPSVIAVARTFILANETSAIQPFVTGTIYSDFGDDQEVTFTDDMNPGILTTTDNLGTFGEVSAGLNYRSLFGDGDGGLRELSASIRGDLTFSDRVLGGRLVGQVRLQF